MNKIYVFFCLFLISGVVQGEEQICVVEKAVLCKYGDCNAIYEEGGYYTVVDTDKEQYLLCESKKEKCDTFPLKEVEKSGVFTIYTTGVGGAVLKIANEDFDLFGFKENQFIEVRHKFLLAFLSWGTCHQR
jgi:hypothetical protein